MKSQNSPSVDVLGFTINCVAVSFLSVVVDVLFGQISDIHGAVGGIGVMATFIGSGVGFWFALRSREGKQIGIALLSIFPLSYWCWNLSKTLHGN